MIPFHITPLLRGVVCSLILGTWTLTSQEPDHLSVHLLFEDSLLHVRAEYRATPQQETDTLLFLLNPGIRPERIEAAYLRSKEQVVRPGRPFPFWALAFERPLLPHSQVAIRFEYVINLASQNHMASEWIELTVDKMWYPIRNDLDNPFSYEVVVEGLPPGYSLITHPQAEVVKEEDRLLLKREQPWYEVMLLAGKDMKTWDGGDGIRFTASQSLSDSLLQSIHGKVATSIAHLNRVMGKADPIGSFTVVLRNTRRSELGYQFNRGPMIITGPDFDDYANLSHEIAHYWWSGADFIREPWMNESFANYGMYSVLREFEPVTFRGLLEKNRAGSAKAIPVLEASLFAENAFDSYYHKGGILLMELEERIGRDRMQTLLSECVRLKIRTTEGFLQELQRQNGLETRDYFEALLKS